MRAINRKAVAGLAVAGLAALAVTRTGPFNWRDEHMAPDLASARATWHAAFEDTQRLLAPVKFSPVDGTEETRATCDRGRGEGESILFPVYEAPKPEGVPPEELARKVAAHWRSKGYPTAESSRRGKDLTLMDVTAELPDGGAIIFGLSSTPGTPMTIHGESGCAPKAPAG